MTDGVVDAIFIAGEAGYCRERMVDIVRIARDHGFHQIMFSELGPDVEESVGLICDDIIPLL